MRLKEGNSMGNQQYDPKHPEKGWQPLTPLPEPRLWKLWRFLRLMK